jgi:5-methylcytosine-specific restriction enzyme A
MILKGIDMKPLNTKAKRGFRYDPFYHTKEWKEFRKHYLIENPLCKFCEEKGLLTTATVLDHIQPRSQGGSDYASWNLQGLCKSCHGKKSSLDKVE